MKKHNLLFTLSLIMITIAALLLTGCDLEAGTTSTAVNTTSTVKAVSPFTQEELRKMVADSLAATKNVQTYKLEMDISSKSTVDNDASKSGGMSMKAAAAFDTKQKQMSMTGDVTSSEADATPQAQALELYVMSDYVYIGATIPQTGKQWVKVKATEEIISSFNADVMQQDMSVMEKPSSIEWIQYAKVKGVECNVIKIIPNTEYLRQYAQEQMSGKFEIDWSKIPDISKMYDSISYVVSIAKDTKYVQKMDINASIIFTSDFAKSTQLEFKNIVTEVNGSIDLYDYNTPVSIVLPAEAKDAIEITPDMLTGSK